MSRVRLAARTHFAGDLLCCCFCGGVIALAFCHLLSPVNVHDQEQIERQMFPVDEESKPLTEDSLGVTHFDCLTLDCT